MPSRSGVRQRQVDILVRSHLPGVPDNLMVVDCKRYGTKVDVDDVESFIGMVEDIGAPLGMLVTTEGYTDGAIRRAEAARGLDVQVIGVDELPQWEPPLITCEVCDEALPEDALPGMAYIDRIEDSVRENLGNLVRTRNRIAHGTTGVSVHKADVTRYRKYVEGFATRFDGLLRTRVRSLTGASPWPT